MSNSQWKFWAVPLTLWGLYSCWYWGYQSGYSDGHETAWTMSRPTHVAHLLRDLVQHEKTAEIQAAEMPMSSAK